MNAIHKYCFGAITAHELIMIACTLIFIMIVIFLAKKENILVPKIYWYPTL